MVSIEIFVQTFEVRTKIVFNSYGHAENKAKVLLLIARVVLETT